MLQTRDLLLFAADKTKLVWDILGALRLEMARQMDLLDKNRPFCMDYRVPIIRSGLKKTALQQCIIIWLDGRRLTFD